MNNSRLSWDEYFSKIVSVTAERSPCDRLKVGCILVKDNRIISQGYNGFLPGCPHNSIVRNNHEQATVHAEQNAICDCAKRGVSCKDSVAYITHYPCIICTRILLASGIKEIKYLEDYKKGKYHTRKKLKSFKSKVSPHILKARKMYKINKIRPTRKLAKASKCSLKGLKRIFKKGQGAYFSSGSRPNQTGHSWGYARMASAITGGKASAVDFHIIKEECKKNSRAYKLAKKARKTYKKGMKRVKQVKIGGK